MAKELFSRRNFFKGLGAVGVASFLPGEVDAPVPIQEVDSDLRNTTQQAEQAEKHAETDLTALNKITAGMVGAMFVKAVGRSAADGLPEDHLLSGRLKPRPLSPATALEIWTAESARLSALRLSGSQVDKESAEHEWHALLEGMKLAGLLAGLSDVTTHEHGLSIDAKELELQGEEVFASIYDKAFPKLTVMDIEERRKPQVQSDKIKKHGSVPLARELSTPRKDVVSRFNNCETVDDFNALRDEVESELIQKTVQAFVVADVVAPFFTTYSSASLSNPAHQEIVELAKDWHFIRTIKYEDRNKTDKIKACLDSSSEEANESSQGRLGLDNAILQVTANSAGHMLIGDPPLFFAYFEHHWDKKAILEIQKSGALFSTFATLLSATGYLVLKCKVSPTKASFAVKEGLKTASKNLAGLAQEMGVNKPHAFYDNYLNTQTARRKILLQQLKKENKPENAGLVRDLTESLKHEGSVSANLPAYFQNKVSGYLKVASDVIELLDSGLGFLREGVEKLESKIQMAEVKSSLAESEIENPSQEGKTQAEGAETKSFIEVLKHECQSRGIPETHMKVFIERLKSLLSNKEGSLSVVNVKSRIVGVVGRVESVVDNSMESVMHHLMTGASKEVVTALMNQLPATDSLVVLLRTVFESNALKSFNLNTRILLVQAFCGALSSFADNVVAFLTCRKVILAMIAEDKGSQIAQDEAVDIAVTNASLAPSIAGGAGDVLGNGPNFSLKRFVYKLGEDGEYHLVEERYNVMDSSTSLFGGYALSTIAVNSVYSSGQLMRAVSRAGSAHLN